MENYWFGRFWKGFLFVFDVYEIFDSENADLWNIQSEQVPIVCRDDSFALCWCVDCLMIESSPPGTADCGRSAELPVGECTSSVAGLATRLSSDADQRTS